MAVPNVQGPMKKAQSRKLSGQNPRLAHGLAFGYWSFFGPWAFVIGHFIKEVAFRAGMEGVATRAEWDVSLSVG